jgi:hypothetical protein
VQVSGTIEGVDKLAFPALEALIEAYEKAEAQIDCLYNPADFIDLTTRRLLVDAARCEAQRR